MPHWTRLLLALALAAMPLVPAQAAASLPAWVVPAVEQAPLGPDELSIRWLGTAGFEFRTARGALLIDPYFSRHNLMQLLAGPIAPDMARIEAHTPKADAVFVGHAHHDHLVDAPAIARKLGVPLYGSRDTASVARAAGLPQSQIRELRGHERIRVGDLEVEAVPSRHSDMITNVLVNGAIAPSPTLPMRFWDYKHGQVFIYVVRWRGRAIYHMGSADMVEAELPPDRADLVLLCMSGWKDNPGIFKRVATALKPRLVAPTHHDDFFRPLEAGFHEGQLAFLKGGLARIASDMPDSRLLNIGMREAVRVRPEDH